MVTQIL